MICRDGFGYTPDKSDINLDETSNGANPNKIC